MNLNGEESNREYLNTSFPSGLFDAEINETPTFFNINHETGKL